MSVKYLVNRDARYRNHDLLSALDQNVGGNPTLLQHFVKEQNQNQFKCSYFYDEQKVSILPINHMPLVFSRQSSTIIFLALARLGGVKS